MIENYVCLDLEMTGLNAKINKILEIGAVKVENNKIVDTFSALVNPGVNIDDKVAGITGISNEMVDKKPYIEDILPKFIDFCGDYVTIGHNLMFDFSFVKTNAVNIGLAFEHRGIDTLKIARKHLPDLEKRTLEYLCGYYNIEDNNHHRAFNDATVTHQLYQKLCQEPFYSEDDPVYIPKPLVYKVKKMQPATARQINYLNDLVKYHKIKVDVSISRLNRSEASRLIDSIILNYGRIQ